MKTFRELGLSRDFVSVLEKAKITIPSEIQEKTIPLVLAGKDVIGGSATGSGKTIAFASSIIENLEKNTKVQALILTPTRELAEQVSKTIAELSRHKRLKVLSIYGGVNIQNQIRLLRNTDVVVGTPGRILDHLSRGTLNLIEVKFLVLDEVDRMFDMGFQKDVQRILEKCPTERQTMLFSATISADIDHLAKKYTKNPTEVSVESHVDPLKLKQVYYDVQDNLKFSLLVHLLKKENAKLVMVFCGTRRNAEFVTKNLNNLGMNVKAIHGGLNQNQRNRVMSEFNSTEGITILICTDIAARGLDIPGVSHIYNYDLPKTSSDYIHRIGRTARAGKEGIAISILCSRDYENFSAISRDDKLKITPLKVPLIERVRIIMDKTFGRYPNTQGGTRGHERGSRDNFSRGPSVRSRNSRGFSREQRNSPPREGKGFSRGRDDKPRNDIRGRSSSSPSRPGGRSFNRGRDDKPRNDSKGFSRGRSNEHRTNYNKRPPQRGRDNERSQSRERPNNYRENNRRTNSRPQRNNQRYSRR